MVLNISPPGPGRRAVIAAVLAVVSALIGLCGCGQRYEVKPASPAAPSSSPVLPHPSPSPLVLIYGDSLTIQSETAVRYLYPQQNVVFKAVSGGGMCDLAPSAAADRRSINPTRVVLAFTGNASDCSAPKGQVLGTLAELVANYEDNLRLFARSYYGIPVTVVGPPAMKNPGGEGFFLYNGSPALIAMYEAVSAELGLRYSAVADEGLTPGHVYTAYRPAFGTTAPLVRVRESDDIHLLPAGEVYYAIALMTP